MKQFFVFFFVLSQLLFFSATNFASDGKTLTILYTGDVKGQIRPIRHCASEFSDWGGLSRRATMIESVRSSNKNVILLDCGGIFPTVFSVNDNDGTRNAKISLRAMNQMGYDAVNLGRSEFYFGTEALKEIHSGLTFPMITSNLVDKETGEYFGKKYIVKDIDGIKIGILGIMPPGAFKGIPPQVLKNLKIIDPEKAMNDLLPEIKKKTDVVILLSQCGLEITDSIVSSFEEVDIAIYGGIGEHSDGSEGNISNKRIFQVVSHGTDLGTLILTLDNKGNIIQIQNNSVKLGNDIPEDEQINNLISDVYLEEKRLKAEKERQEMHRKIQQEAESLWKLSPREYVEEMQENQ